MNQAELIAIIGKTLNDGLTELDLSKEGLTSLPPEIGNLTDLLELDLSGNALTELSLIHI